MERGDQEAGGRLSFRGAWIPVPLFMILIALLRVFDSPGVFLSPPLLFTLNLLFGTLTALFVAWFFGRSFLIRAEPALLLMACGTYVWGVTTTVAVAAGVLGPNFTVTVHNLGVWLFGCCTLAGALLGRSPGRSRMPGLLLHGAFMAATAAVVLVGVGTAKAWYPLFFVQGDGGTPLRQAVLLTAVGMLSLAGLLLLRERREKRSLFLYLFALGLLLLAVGLAGVMMPKTFGSPLSWAGRAAQYLGGLYLMGAAVAAAYETRGWSVSLTAALQESEAQHRKLQDRLKWERDVLQAVMNGAGDIHLVYLDRDFNFVRVNASYASDCGFTPEEMIGKNHFALYPHAENEAIFRRVRDTGQPFSIKDKPFEFPDQPERGVTYWDWSLLPVKRPSGEVEGLIFTLHETTARKRFEERLLRAANELREANAALRRSEELLRIFVEFAPAAIAMMDAEMRYVAASRRWLRDYGVAGSILGQSHYAVFPDIPERWKEIHRRCLAGAVERSEEDAFTRADGSVQWLRWEIHPWYREPGVVGGLVIFSEDITASKMAERNLKQTAEQLARSNRELEQFASVTSHDLQEPLRMVSAFAGMLRDLYAGKLDPRGGEYLAFIIEGVGRMQTLISDLLSYSRLSGRAMERKPVSLAEPAQLALANLKASIDESGAIVDLGDLPVVEADSLQIQQVFQNLIGNAIKYRKPGVPPRVRLDAVREAGALGGGEWLIAVRDNGIGIDPLYKDRIFEIFQRLHTREEYEGTGIGLAICKKIVEAHGGRIWVESAPGEGSAFLFTLPAS